jgi:hypothetical protein
VRDPFKLVEENGYYYARGIADDKMMAATWADTLIRFKQAGYKPARTVKMALTCGEETDTAFNGAQYLANNKRDLIDAAFALNEGGGGDTDGKGHLIDQSIQVGEKIYRTTSSSRPIPAGTARSRCAPTRSTHVRGAAEDPRPRVPAGIQRHHPRVLRARRRRAQGTHWARRWWRWRKIPAMRSGGGGQHRQGLPLDAAHDLRGDDDRRRPRGERIAAAGRNQRQLPHLPGHTPAEIQDALRR